MTWKLGAQCEGINAWRMNQIAQLLNCYCFWSSLALDVLLMTYLQAVWKSGVWEGSQVGRPTLANMCWERHDWPNSPCAVHQAAAKRDELRHAFWPILHYADLWTGMIYMLHCHAANCARKHLRVFAANLVVSILQHVCIRWCSRMSVCRSALQNCKDQTSLSAKWSHGEQYTDAPLMVDKCAL